MPKCVIDGVEVEFKPGENLIEIAKRAGIEIPFFCYHPGLTVVAQCRMCAVEVEKMPKLQTACSTPATDGMVVKTKSDRVVQAQKATMEFLLINHPLDCPICDKSGECDLQDFSYQYGDAYSRYTEDRRTYVDLDMGPVIKKNMNRCIHCTRCIRFGDEIAKVHEMVAVKRGNNTEITTIDGRPLETDYAGNYADICPTGSLTLQDFRFKKRVWYLKKTPTVCEGCARGCNMIVHQENEVIHRTTPRENMEINKYWLCDEGRFSFRNFQDPTRLTQPAIVQGGALNRVQWSVALETGRSKAAGKKTLVLLGSDITQEEAKLSIDFASKNFPGSTVKHFGTPGVKTSKDDDAADALLKRKSRTGNLHGLEKLGVQAYDGALSGYQVVVVIRGGRAVLPELKGVDVIGVGVFKEAEVKNFVAVLPAPGFAEREGTVVNFEGREQKTLKAIQPPGMTRSYREIFQGLSSEARL